MAKNIKKHKKAHLAAAEIMKEARAPVSSGTKLERSLALTVGYGPEIHVTVSADEDTWNRPAVRPTLNKLLATLVAVLADAGTPAPGGIQHVGFEMAKQGASGMKLVARSQLVDAKPVDRTLLLSEQKPVPPPYPVPPDVRTEPETTPEPDGDSKA